jgi:methyl-accepting chemotaxis protein
VPIGFQVMIGAGGLVALLTAAILAALLVVVGLRNDAARADRHDGPYGSAVAAAALDAKGIANDERGFLLTGDTTFLEEADSRIANARAAFDTATAAASTAAEQNSVNAARAGFEQWVQAVQQGFATFQSGQPASAISASVGPNRALRKTYEDALSRAQTLATSSSRSAENSFDSHSRRSVQILLVCLIIGLAVGVRIAFWLVRSIALPVYRLISILQP